MTTEQQPKQQAELAEGRCCWPWSHKWTKWKSATFIMTRMNKYKLESPQDIEVLRQKRECIKCGLVETKPYGED